MGLWERPWTVLIYPRTPATSTSVGRRNSFAEIYTEGVGNQPNIQMPNQIIRVPYELVADQSKRLFVGNTSGVVPPNAEPQSAAGTVVLSQF